MSSERVEGVPSLLREVINDPALSVGVQRVAPLFKMVFLSVLALTVLFFFVQVAFVIAGTDGSSAQSLENACATAWQLGFGGLVGLIGGKAAS
jgi:hypothetical protein